MVYRTCRRIATHKRRPTLSCETLESRVVLTYGGPSNLLGSLSYVGVVTTPIPSVPTVLLPINPVPASSNASVPFGIGSEWSTAWTKLRTDLQTLQTELQSLAAKSGVTVQDLQNLTNDSQAISQAGVHFQASTLNPVISELAVAVAGGTSTSQAQTDFNNLFNNSSVPTTVINTTFNDLVKTIQDSAVTTTDLSTVATDEAAIQSDLPKIPSPMIPAGQAWLDDVGNMPTALSLASTITIPAPIIALPVFPASQAPPAIASPLGDFNSLLGSLSLVGVVASPMLPPASIGSVVPITLPPPLQPALAGIAVLPNIPATSTGPWSQLQSDVQKLQTELQSLAEKSGLTIADQQALTNDSQAIAQAGFCFTPTTLNPVISELATAVAGGSSTNQAQTDFTALFGASSQVSSTTITNTFNDLVKAIKDSAVSTTDLAAVAADQAAIQTDIKNLFPGNNGGGTGTTGTGTGTTGSTGSGSTGTGSTGTSSAHGHKHKPLRPAHVTVKLPKVAHTTKAAHATKLTHAARALSRLTKH